MLIAEATRRAIELSRQTKEEHVLKVEGRRGQTDILTMIACYRGEEHVATIFHQPHRDRMLEIAWLAAAGFGADIMSVTMETYHSQRENNPLTGKPWGPNEMGEVADKGGLSRGWVNEALVTQVVNRAGDSRQVFQPYKVKRNNPVEWLTGMDTEEESFTATGLVSDTLVRAMQNDTAMQMVNRLGVQAAMSVDETLARRDLVSDTTMPRVNRHGMQSNMSVEETLARTDLVTVREIEKRFQEADADVMVLLSAEQGSERQRLIAERYPDGEV